MNQPDTILICEMIEADKTGEQMLVFEPVLESADGRIAIGTFRPEADSPVIVQK